MGNDDGGGGGGGGGADGEWFVFDNIGDAGKNATNWTGGLDGPPITLCSLVYNCVGVPWFV